VTCCWFALSSIVYRKVTVTTDYIVAIWPLPVYRIQSLNLVLQPPTS